MIRNSRILLVVVFLLAGGVPAAAVAQESAEVAAKAHYEKGLTHYNLGRFKQAIQEFEQGYELSHSPVMLFNIAQAHRQDGNIERAIFFYRRYLSMAPGASNRSDVQKRIKDLEELQDRQNDIKKRPPTEVERDGASPAPGAATEPTPEPDVPTVPGNNAGATTATTTATATTLPLTSAETAPVTATPEAAPLPSATTARPGVLDLTLAAGGSQPVLAGSSLSAPLVFVGELQASHGWLLGNGKTIVDVGAQLSLSPMSYRRNDSQSSEKTSLFIGTFVFAGVRHPIAPRFSLLAQLGLGCVWWAGLGANNPFTVGGGAADAPIGLPAVRVSAGLRYDTTMGLFAAVIPSYGFAVKAGSDIEAVSGIHFVDGVLALGYSF